MIGNLALFLIKYLCVSTLLALLYMALFRDKASFLSRRLFLLALPVVAVLAALVSVDVFAVASDNVLGQAVDILSSDPELMPVSSNSFVVESGDKIATPMTLSGIAHVIWLVVMALLLCRMIYRLYTILAIRRLSSRETINCSMQLCKSALVETPFSFMRSIYVNRTLSGNRLDIILKHEMAHISHRHSLDRVLAELYIVVSWFNPVVYFINRELSAVHEYEADSEALSGGCDKREYKQLLFDEITHSTPSLSNGFNNSLIKKRFIQMKQNYQIKNRLLRKVVTLPLIALVFSLTSLTYVNGRSIATTIEKSAEKSVSSADDPKPEKPKPNYYRLKKGEYEYVKPSEFKEVRVIRHKNYTAVESTLRVLWNSHWTAFVSNSFLVDPESGDQYQIHSLKGGLPLNRPLSFIKEKGNYVMITAIFPPLKSGVEKVHLIDRETPGYIPGNNDGGLSSYFNLKVEPYDKARPHVIK